MFATYQRKLQEAEHEAQAIIASAKAEAERLAAEAETKIEEFVERHTKMAESKISQAEAQALADVRSAAAEAAVAAAERFLPIPSRARSPTISSPKVSPTSRVSLTRLSHSIIAGRP